MATVSGNIIRVSARQKFNAIDDIVNVFHFTVQANPDATDQAVLDEAAGKMSLAWAEIVGLITNNISPNVVDVYNVTQDYPLGSTAWGSLYTGGTASGEGLPTGVAALILWNTAVKRVQGKTYLGGFSEATQNDGQFTGGTVTDMATFANVMLDLTPVVGDCSLLLGVWSAAAGEMRPIVSRRIVEIAAYQRRRRPGRGS